MKLSQGVWGMGMGLVVFACAQSGSDIPDDGNANTPSGTTTDNSQTLPPSNPPKGSSTSSTSSGGSTSSSGSTTSSSGSTTSSSGGSSSGTAPACSFSGDFTKLISKASEIQAGAPCDSTCDAATHCCLDLTGGAGASGGLPGSSGSSGASGGLPGLDAGTSSGGTSGGLPTGGSGVCVTNN